jgi:hypothetical protein
MLPLYEDRWFTFRFGDDRLLARIQLEGVPAGQRVSVFKMDPGTGERLGLLTTGTVGEEGWVDLTEPIIVRAGEAFVAVPEKDGLPMIGLASSDRKKESGELGFEPRQADPESAVLPLHHSPSIAGVF